MSLTILFVAGDVSGDLHGARLISAIKRRHPSAKLIAVGGRAMAQAADRSLADLVSLSVSGFWEPLRQIGPLRRILRDIVQPAILEADLVVPIDYYGFNIHVCRLAKNHGKRIFYYVSPQVWASRSYRAKELARCHATMLTIFPFEESFYKERGTRALFVGHPLLDVLPEPDRRPSPKAGVWTIGLLPGSRRDEIRRHWPLLVEAAQEILRHRSDVRFKVFESSPAQEKFYTRPSTSLPLSVVHETDYHDRRSLDLAITCSGTATLENALLGIPMAVVYKTSWPTYWIARAIIQVKTISMVNILAGKILVPEFIQDQATPSNLAKPLLDWMNNPQSLISLREELLNLKPKLGSGGSAENAADVILKSLTINDYNEKVIAVS